jgi:hypothetical protein
MASDSRRDPAFGQQPRQVMETSSDPLTAQFALSQCSKSPLLLTNANSFEGCVTFAHPVRLPR